MTHSTKSFPTSTILDGVEPQLVSFVGVDHQQYLEVLDRGVDHGGNPIEPFVDAEGGWPLRCCLADSAPGDRIAIIAWSPFPWRGAYAETGPIVVHAEPCEGVAPLDHLPTEFDSRPMTLRPYTHDHRIHYERVTHLPTGAGITAAVVQLLGDPDIAEVYGRNATGGCFAFRASRA